MARSLFPMEYHKASFLPEGEIILSEGTVQQVSERFDVAEIGPVQVKGKMKPVIIYRVLGDKSLPSVNRV